jgi:GAF domain-containing protein
MYCVSYAGYEGQQDTGGTVFRNSPEDPVGQYMFRLLAGREAQLIPDVEAAGLPVRFPSRGGYQTIIATAIMAGDTPYGILTLDSPQADSLGQPDLEIMKTLANLLGVGLALAARGSRRPPHVPAQGNRDVAIGNDLLVPADGISRRPNWERGEGHACESRESCRSGVDRVDRAARRRPERRGLLRVGGAPCAERGGARPRTPQAA